WRTSSSLMLEGVVKRLCWSNHPWLIRHGHRQDANALVVRQRDCPHARRNIERVCEQIRISVRLSAAGGVATLRTEPGDVRAFDKTWAQTNHLAVWINADARWSSRRRALRRWDLLLGHFPNSIVPLANKPGPFLNRQVSCFVSKLERSFLIF